MNDLSVHVLFRFSKKTGEIDTTMTSLGSALLKMWALNNTPKTKACMVFERESGNIVFASYGTKDGFPKVKSGKDCEGQTCVEFGIPLEELHAITDDRFDSEVV